MTTTKKTLLRNIMVASLQLWLIQNAMKLLSILALTTISLGAVSYWKHTIANETEEKCNAAWIERDRKDIAESARMKAEREGEIKTIIQSYEAHNEHELSKYREYVETLTAANVAANANVDKLRKYQTTRKASCPIGVSAEANNTGGIGGTGEEAIQIAKSLKAVQIIIEDYVEKYFEVVE